MAMFEFNFIEAINFRCIFSVLVLFFSFFEKLDLFANSVRLLMASRQASLIHDHLSYL